MTDMTECRQYDNYDWSTFPDVGTVHVLGPDGAYNREVIVLIRKHQSTHKHIVFTRDIAQQDEPNTYSTVQRLFRKCEKCSKEDYDRCVDLEPSLLPRAQHLQQLDDNDCMPLPLELVRIIRSYLNNVLMVLDEMGIDSDSCSESITYIAPVMKAQLQSFSGSMLVVETSWKQAFLLASPRLLFLGRLRYEQATVTRLFKSYPALQTYMSFGQFAVALHSLEYGTYLVFDFQVQPVQICRLVLNARRRTERTRQNHW